MKVFLSVLCLFGAILSAEAINNEIFSIMDVLAKKCGEELNVDMSAFKVGEIPDIALFEKEEYKCIPKCFMEKLQLIDADGNFQADKLKGSDVPENVLTTFEECSKEHTEADMCLRFVHILKCQIEKMKVQ